MLTLLLHPSVDDDVEAPKSIASVHGSEREEEEPEDPLASDTDSDTGDPTKILNKVRDAHRYGPHWETRRLTLPPTAQAKGCSAPRGGT